MSDRWIIFRIVKHRCLFSDPALYFHSIICTPITGTLTDISQKFINYNEKIKVYSNFKQKSDLKSQIMKNNHKIDIYIDFMKLSSTKKKSLYIT